MHSSGSGSAVLYPFKGVPLVAILHLTLAHLHPAKCPFTCQFDWLSDQFRQSLDRLSDHSVKH